MVEEAVPEEAAVPIAAEPVAVRVVRGAKASPAKVVRVVGDLAIQTNHHKKPVDCTGNSGKEPGHALTDTGAHGETTRAQDRAMIGTLALLK